RHQSTFRRSPDASTMMPADFEQQAAHRGIDVIPDKQAPAAFPRPTIMSGHLDTNATAGPREANTLVRHPSLPLQRLLSFGHETSFGGVWCAEGAGRSY